MFVILFCSKTKGMEDGEGVQEDRRTPTISSHIDTSFTCPIQLSANIYDLLRYASQVAGPGKNGVGVFLPYVEIW